MPGSSEYKSLGASPVHRKLSEVQGMAENSKTILIEARKSGYVSRSVVITDADTSSDVRLSFELPSLEKAVKEYVQNNPESKNGAGSDALKLMLTEANQKNLLETNHLIDQLFEAQRMSQVGRLEDANKRLEELQKTYPHVAAIYEMQGGIAFMQADFNKALDAYSEALRNNPENVELLHLRAYLQKKLNIQPRQPAGAN
jgi:tetratricopeptide (TPR) repeat protein